MSFFDSKNPLVKSYKAEDDNGYDGDDGISKETDGYDYRKDVGGDGKKDDDRDNGNEATVRDVEDDDDCDED